ncbi:hypothetical protein L1987_33543 [Smallanthus sonchifolius]|uniref:Uncharacterized protein n=1 Tax=Smallanthus sonchifolius TaxID=185202 RepID=A0ACB9HRP4_9ASTR|nr:hypothetical protein L1987_33543 [Smallanthus sonchifolius]
MICFDAGFNDSPPQSLSGYLLVTTNPPGYLIFIAQVEILNNVQPFKGIRKGNLVSYLQLLFLQVIRGCLLEGQGGVTHVQFSKDGNYLYIEGRKVVSGSLYDEAAVMVIYAVILDCKLMLEESTNNYG